MSLLKNPRFAFSAKRKLENPPHLKYFINRSVILQQYREACKLAYKFQDPHMREDILGMMRDEFEGFRKFNKAFQPDEEVQTSVDYQLAKTR